MGMVAGGDELSVLRLLADPEEFKKRLVQYNELNENVKKTLADMAIADDIRAAKKAAEDDRAGAAELLAQTKDAASAQMFAARAACDKMVAAAQASASAIMAEATAAREEAAKVTTEAQALMNQAAQAQHEMDVRARTLAAVEQSIAERQRDADTREAELDIKARKFESLKKIIGSTLE